MLRRNPTDLTILNHCNTTTTSVSSQSQCKSSVVQNINAPISSVWSILRQFDKPQLYKNFIRDCSLTSGDGGIGSIRELQIVSGLPANTSIERLDTLDEDLHVAGFSIVGGDHRLVNYRSIVTLEESVDEPGSTIATECYVVDVPVGNSVEETCLFINTIIKCNLSSLAGVSCKINSGSLRCNP